jgi:HEPN domain-containing protein
VVVLTATASTPEKNAGFPPGLGLAVVRLGLAPGETPRLLLKAWRGLRFFGLALAWGFWHGRRGQRLLIASNPPFIGLLGPILQLRGLEYVFLCQDLFPRSAVLSGLMPARSPLTSLWSALMAWVCRRSRCTVVLSEAMAEALQQDCGPGLPLQVIHNWAVEQALPGDRAHNPFARELGVEQLFTVQYSGNFGRLHDLDTLWQAAEKALKALILELGAEPPHTHVLGELLKLLGKLGCELEALEALPLRSLSRLSVTSRYPLEATPPAELFDRADADQAIGTAEAVLSLVEALDQPL